MKNKIKALFFAVLYAILHYSIQLGIVTIVTLTYLIPKFISSVNTNDGFNKLYEGIMENGNMQLIAILISSIISIGIYILIGRKRFGNIKDKLKFKKLDLKTIVLSLIMGVGLLFLSNIVILIFSGIGILDEANMKELENINSMLMDNSNGLLMIMTVGIIVPIAEELLFRGLIFREIEEKFKIVPTVLITGIGFGIFHMVPVQIVYASFLGIIMGAVFYWTKSIYAPILLHIANNTASSIMAVFTKNIDLESLSDIKKLDNGNVEDLAVLGFLGIVVFMCFVSIPFIMRYFYKNRVQIEKLEEI